MRERAGYASRSKRGIAVNPAGELHQVYFKLKFRLGVQVPQKLEHFFSPWA